jgi:hypothetical protein
MPTRLVLLIAALTVLATAPSARASDFSHACTTVGDLYEIDDGTLTRKADSKRSAIPYEVLRETVLSHRQGHCMAKGQRYEFEAKSYVRRIRFRDGGQPMELEALCELAADGLPAAMTCEREVITYEFKSGGGRTSPSSSPRASWSHNGSLMQLVANGAERRFVYEVPRRGLIEVGVKAGAVVFEGQREGNTYTGTAYIFTKACGRVGYPVAGNVSTDERRVVLEGQVPLHNPNCSVRAYRRDRLQFDLVER